jgi:hypothetical protein
MAACNVHAMPFRAVQLGHCRDDSHPDPDPLIIWQRDDPREPAVILSGDEGHRCAKIYRHSVPHRYIASRSPRKLAAQIVMTLKQLPRSHVAAVERKLDRRSPKTPPR